MTLTVCLFTDSLEPSGVGESMLTLAAELREQYRLCFVCPPGALGNKLLTRAHEMGLVTLGYECRSRQQEAELTEWLRAQGVKIFHCHAGIGWEGHHGIYAASWAHVPFGVRTEHLPDMLTDPLQRRDYKRIVGIIDRVICVSDSAHASFIKAGVPEKKLRLVRNGIARRTVMPDRDGIRARLGLPRTARIVLTVGRMVKQKGYDLLLDAIPAVLAREPKTHFVWVGGGELEVDLQNRAREMGLQNRICFAGLRDDVADLMAAADVFVLPSRFEGLPLAVLEAMAAKLPVVGTRVCGITEAVLDGQTGRLVEPGDVKALAHALLQVLENPELAIRWGAAGRWRVQQEFSAARMGRETASIYEALAQPERAGAFTPEEIKPKLKELSMVKETTLTTSTPQPALIHAAASENSAKIRGKLT